jgi:hypothetical protein
MLDHYEDSDAEHDSDAGVVPLADYAALRTWFATSGHVLTRERPTPDHAAVARSLLAATMTLQYRSLSDKIGHQGLFDWLSTPRLGDLVAVVWAAGPALRRVGYYESSWSYVTEEDYSRGNVVHKIRKLDGTSEQWGNCGLLRVPDGTEPS